ncbi:hypothetical protein GWI33_007512 [Rhynchophorus ferrugineus]|uniref:Uncharacterized protein n=1 Tax=Rhynchophorus ferrugineus TaxID=354439 RepID=A0A834IEC3_RHYFE|nr:hypothetical protein GWI33_007512 [Rhynchophorus ferrugineus]
MLLLNKDWLVIEEPEETKTHYDPRSPPRHPADSLYPETPLQVALVAKLDPAQTAHGEGVVVSRHQRAQMKITSSFIRLQMALDAFRHYRVEGEAGRRGVLTVVCLRTGPMKGVERDNGMSGIRANARRPD